MKILGQIAIAIFVINNMLFDLISIYENTKLNIVFFSITYFTLLLFCVKEHFDNVGSIKDAKKLSFSLVMGIGFTIRIIFEFTKWNLPFDEYMVSVNDFETFLLFTFLLITLLLIPITDERRN